MRHRNNSNLHYKKLTADFETSKNVAIQTRNVGSVKNIERNKRAAEYRSIRLSRSPVKMKRPFTARNTPKKRIIWSIGEIPNTRLKKTTAASRSRKPRILTRNI